MSDTDDHLRRWQEAGILDAETARRIRDFEAAQRQSFPPAEVEIPRPSLVEALLYLGVAVVAVGVILLLGPNWSELTSAARIAVVGVPAILALVAGWAMRATGAPPFVRGGDLTWLAATWLTTAAIGVMAYESGMDDDPLLLLTGATSLVVALALWVLAPSYPQILGLGAAIFFFVQAIGGQMDDYSTTLVGMMLLVAGAAGIAFTEMGMVRPLPGAVVVFSMLAAFGAFFAGLDGHVLWAELLAFAVAAGLMALSLWRGRFVYLLAGVGLAFVQLVAFIFEYFSDQIGAPLALIISGAVLIAAVLMLIPMRQIVRRKPLAA